jgi:hypothetical protein
MKIVLHIDGSESLRARVAEMGVELCPESELQLVEDLRTINPRE